MKKTLIFLLALTLFSQIQAQERQRQWIGFSYEAFESKQSNLTFAQRLRWQDQNFHQWISELDYKTDLGKDFSAGAEFRYILEKDRSGAIQGNRTAGRIRLNLYHEIDTKPLEIKNRAGIQFKRRFDDKKDNLVFRFRPQITPKIRNFKHDPSFRIEWFQNLETTQDYSIRYGIDIPFKFDNNRLRFGYFYEAFNLQSQENQQVIYARYKFGR
jgi:hypothetical protein